MARAALLKRMNEIATAVEKRAASAIYIPEKDWSPTLLKRRDIWNENCIASGMNRFEFLLKHPAPLPPLRPEYLEMSADPVGVEKLCNLQKDRWTHV